MDDFEFKSLTDGLGFHKKAQRLKSEAQQPSLSEDVFSKPLPQVPDALLDSEDLTSSSVFSTRPTTSFFGQEETSQRPSTETNTFISDSDRPASASISELMASLPPSLDFEGPSVELPSTRKATNQPSESLFSPMGKNKVEDLVESNQAARKSPTPQRQLSQHLTSPVSPMTTKPLPRNTEATPGVKRSMDASLEKAFPKRDLVSRNVSRNKNERDQVQEDAKAYAQLQPVSQAIIAAGLDAVVIAGISIICMVILSFVIQVDLMRLLFDPRTSSTATLQLVVLFLGITQIYMLAARGLFGMTLGDWAFDLQLGNPQQQYSVKFPVLVLWRSIVATLTGFVVFPFLSALLKRDLFMYVTGLQLYKKNQ